MNDRISILATIRRLSAFRLVMNLVGLATLASVLLIPVASLASPVAQLDEPPMGEWLLDTVADWQAGEIIPEASLLLTNNAGGELRLAEDQATGTFVSEPFEPDAPFNAVGAVWRAEIPAGADLQLELRGRVAPLTATIALDLDTDGEVGPDAGWTDWQSLIAYEDRSLADDGALASPAVIAFPAGTRYVQLRIAFASTVQRASAILDMVKVFFFDTTQGPESAAGSPRTPIRFGGNTLTPRPLLIERSTWNARPEALWNSQANPRGVVIHQINAPAGVGATMALLRALTIYQTQSLGWDDLTYHYIIDRDGALYEGRLGGPTTKTSRLANGDTAVHVALIGDALVEPSTTVQHTLVDLLAWLGQAYGIDPTGEHSVLEDNERVTRPNIASYSEIATAADRDTSLRNLMPEIRAQADQATVRARWYFAEGNVRDYRQRLALFNPTDVEASVTVTLLDPDSPTLRTLTAPAKGRVDLTLNDIVSATTTLPAIVESDAPIIAERALATDIDIDNNPGIDRLSRIWYFAEGSTESAFDTYLALFNPQAANASVTVAFMQSDGAVVERSLTVPAGQRFVIVVRDVLPNTRFGARITSSVPIAVERTMRFGPDRAGLHTGRGVVELARRWYFAEGTTQRGFELRVLLLNPNNQIARVTVTFLAPDGQTEERRYALPPTAQLTVNVNEVIPDEGVATIVESDRPIAAERALYFNDGATGTVSTGMSAPAYTWRFADGRTNDASYFLLLGNPNRRPAVVTVDFVLTDGSIETQQIRMPANARYTMAVHEIVPGEERIAAEVSATQPIVAERSLFLEGADTGGSTTPGTPDATGR